jgi:transposase
MKAPDFNTRAEVMRLHYLEGLSLRKIAKRLRLSRKTVRRHLGRIPEALQRQAVARGSLLDPYEAAIKSILAEMPEVTAPQVLERLRKQGYSGGISILRDRIRKLRPNPEPKAYLTIDFSPGEVMQVDWADFGFALPGIPRRVSAFVAMLGHSRYLYLEFTLSQAMGSFLRCMDRALAFFGGVTTADVFDNMKTVVLEHRPGLRPRFNPRFLSYANARGGFAVIACTPHYPEGKAGVERGIRFVRERFWSGRRFQDLFDLNAQAAEWRDVFANGREHETTGKVPALVYDHVEKPRLKPLPNRPFDTDDLDSDTVTKLFRVRFDRNIYSVPWRLVSQRILIRASDTHVRAFLGTKCVAEHSRCWGIGLDIEAPAHRRELQEFRRQDSVDVARMRFGDVGKKYFAALAAGTRSIRRESIRLNFLAEVFGSSQTLSAMTEVMSTGHVGVAYVEYVLRHKRRLEPAFTPLELGNPALDSITLREPDMTLYDPPVMTRDPDEPPENNDTEEIEE